MSKRKSSRSSLNPEKRSRVSQPEHEDEDEKASGTSSIGDNTALTQSAAGEVGIIMSISLKNFMCHSLLGPFEFGPNVNFIVGNNGSGKSAVLTALIVALGGKANTTHRGSSLKGFVKEGESSADVSIIMKNMGRDAYKPERFGMSIVIDLRISSEGVRTYKLRSGTGHLVSSKKEELMSMLDHFNIQVDNPVSILTQEMSKHFLHSKGEGDKYKFFLKATQLEQMKEDYSYIMKTKTMTQNTVEKNKENLHDLKKKFQEHEERFKNLASLDDMEKKLRELKNQMAWALVAEVEQEIKPMTDRIAAEERHTVKYDEKVHEWEEKIKESNGVVKNLQDQLDGVMERIQLVEPQCVQLKERLRERRKDLNAAQGGLHRKGTCLKDLEKDKDQLTKRINELKHSINQSNSADSQARMAKMDRIQAELDELHFKDSTLAQQIDQFKHAYESAKETVRKMRDEEQVMQDDLQRKSRDLSSLESSRHDRIRRFGEQMPALLKAINEADNRRQFTKKPVGPIGCCIRLRDNELDLAVESCLKSLINAFCCDNYNDEKLLQKIMRSCYKHGGRPSIIVSPFTDNLYDVRSRAVNHPQYPTVLQALEIENPVVANCLIDMRGIESILLIKNTNAARSVMQCDNPPRNCKEAFTREGDQVFVNRYYSSELHRARFLSRDVEVQIRDVQSAIRLQETHLNENKQKMQRVIEDERRNHLQYRRTVEDHKGTQERRRFLESEMTELMNIDEPQSEDLKPLEDELDEIQSRIHVCRQEYEVELKKVQIIKKESDEAEQLCRQEEMALNKITEEADPIKLQLSKSDQDLERNKHHKKHYQEKLKSHLEMIKTLKRNLTVKQQELQDSEKKASEIFPERLEVRRTAKSLDSEISRLKFKLETQQDQQGDKETIIREYCKAKEEFNNMFQLVKGLEAFLRSLGEIMNTRHDLYAELRRILAVRCKYYFNVLLAQRGYTGKMTFDHRSETLSISVQPGDGDKAALSDMRSLSGGERSFSTVCLILSVWSIAEAPFRALDEFDVYMDMVNRRISMDMMLKVAAGQRNRQFILLTPQSMSSLQEDSLIKILRLNDPDRGQSTLPLCERSSMNA